ncbi:MAG: hypothetical protein AB3X41_06870 [Leptothrix ochracea]
MKIASLGAVIFLAVPLTASSQEPGKEKEFFQAFDRKIGTAERTQWDAYVSREGADNLARSYYQFAVGACQAMKQGVPERMMIDNYAEFFGHRAKPLVAAAKEVVCPELDSK